VQKQLHDSCAQYQQQHLQQRAFETLVDVGTTSAAIHTQLGGVESSLTEHVAQAQANHDMLLARSSKLQNMIGSAHDDLTNFEGGFRVCDTRFFHVARLMPSCGGMWVPSSCGMWVGGWVGG
jgi:hypothetical protein